MQLSDGQGTSLSLRVVGYQFPDSNEPYDADWLIIQGAVQHPRGSWTFRDACLLTWELERLCCWLEAVVLDPGQADDEAGFIEPNLEFRLRRSKAGHVLWIRLTLECAPPWQEKIDDRVDGIVLQFLLDRANLSTAARDLREGLSRYPKRVAP